jgi:hypothetical protein
VIDRYHNAELALSLPNYERFARSHSPHGKIKIWQFSAAVMALTWKPIASFWNS